MSRSARRDALTPGLKASGADRTCRVGRARQDHAGDYGHAHEQGAAHGHRLDAIGDVHVMGIWQLAGVQPSGFEADAALDAATDTVIEVSGRELRAGLAVDLVTARLNGAVCVGAARIGHRT